MEAARRTLLALLVGAVGAGLAYAAGFPAPFLTGPAILVSLAGLAGLTLDVPKWLAQLCFVVIGLSIGAGVSPEVLVSARQWPASFLLLAVALFAILLSSGFALRRFFGYDRMTALLASSPGHLSYVLGLSAEINADIRLITLVQSIRLLFLTLIVPVAISFLGTPPDGGVPVVVPTPPGPLLVMFTLSVALGLLLMRLHVPAALLIGGMVVSTAGYLSGAASGAMSNWLVIPAFLIMGTLIGTRFSGVTLPMLRSTAWAGLTSTAISSAVAACFAILVAVWLGLPVGQSLVAFMPGGVEAMIAMAVLLDADPTFVAAHHIARLFILTALVPLMIGRRKTSS